MPVRSTRRELAKTYSKFEKVIAPAAGHPRRLSETPEEYLTMGRRRLGPLYPQAVRINQSFEIAMFGPAEPTSPEIALLDKEVMEFQVACKKTLAAAGAKDRQALEHAVSGREGP